MSRVHQICCQAVVHATWTIVPLSCVSQSIRMYKLGCIDRGAYFYEELSKPLLQPSRGVI